MSKQIVRIVSRFEYSGGILLAGHILALDFGLAGLAIAAGNEDLGPEEDYVHVEVDAGEGLADGAETEAPVPAKPKRAAKAKGAPAADPPVDPPAPPGSSE